MLLLCLLPVLSSSSPPRNSFSHTTYGCDSHCNNNTADHSTATTCGIPPAAACGIQPTTYHGIQSTTRRILPTSRCRTTALCSSSGLWSNSIPSPRGTRVSSIPRCPGSVPRKHWPTIQAVMVHLEQFVFLSLVNIHTFGW